MAVKTTKIQCNQDVDLRGKVDVEGDVTCGKNLEVDGQVTINSAKDLKTKDGTGFGSDTSPWKVVGEELIWGYEARDGTSYQVLGIAPMESGLINIIQDTKESGPLNLILEFSTTGALSQDIGLFICINELLNITSKVILPDDFATKSQIINLGDININKENIAKKQSTLYRHTVTFCESGLGYNNRFTAYSEKNTPIDSIQDLITVFGNTELMCAGTIESGSDICTGINIGTTADTILFLGTAGATQKLSSWYSTGPDTTLTITDNVTAM